MAVCGAGMLPGLRPGAGDGCGAGPVRCQVCHDAGVVMPYWPP